MESITLTGLLKIELVDHTVLLCDGGTVSWGGDNYAGYDDFFGAVKEVESISEGLADEAPAFIITFLPPPDVDAADLIAPAHQNARLRGWIAELDEDGSVTGTPDQFCDMLIDVARLRFPQAGRELEIDCVGGGQRLMNLHEANVLNGGMHRRMYLSETGMDDTTGVQSTFAWGAGSARGVR